MIGESMSLDFVFKCTSLMGKAHFGFPVLALTQSTLKASSSPFIDAGPQANTLLQPRYYVPLKLASELVDSRPAIFSLNWTEAVQRLFLLSFTTPG